MRAGEGLTDRAGREAEYPRRRSRVLLATLLGYAIFYLCRKNISVALPVLGRELGYTNTQLGILASLLYVTYGAGKLVNGVAGDHLNARVFVSLGLVLTAAVNFA